MAMFTDTVTIYQKQTDGTHERTIVAGVQWSEKVAKTNMTGRMQSDKVVTITFPEAVLDQLDLSAFTEEDAVVFGEVYTDISSGYRISVLLKDYPRSGIIREINDNSNRDFLKNIKVVVY